MVPLEDEVVSQVLALNKSFERKEREQEVQEKCAAIREYGGMTIDDKKVNVAMKRYFILEEYLSQNNNRKTIRKRKIDAIDAFMRKEVENIANPSIISYKVKYSWRIESDCDICKSPRRRIIYLEICRLKKDIGFDKVKEKRGYNLCEACGSITKRN